jgi:hypothetical protein
LWLVDNLALAGQTDRATALFERLLGQANDLGQLAGEIDPPVASCSATSPRPSAMSGSSAPPPTSNAAVEPTELRPADPSRPVLGTDEQLVERKPSNRAGRRTRRRPAGKPVGPSGRAPLVGRGCVMNQLVNRLSALNRYASRHPLTRPAEPAPDSKLTSVSAGQHLVGGRDRV